MAAVASAHLAYSMDIERRKVRLEGRDEIVPMALRATAVYRREGEEWKMVHRPADNLVPIQGYRIGNYTVIR